MATASRQEAIEGERRSSLCTPAYWLAAGLAMAIGWGIRGNFGHEAGAMIAGVLGALAVVLLSGRDDWLPRIPWFAALGGLGWSFGGSMSYMQVIAYTHSGHSPSVLYGFASLFLLGFLWAAFGGAGTALPALWPRERLRELVPPLIAVFAAWTVRDILETRFIAVNPDFRQTDPLYWLDSDWTAALLALIAVGLYAAARQRWDPACSLIAHMAVGWWAGFLLLPVWLDIRMTPPRGDNWAGCLGMAVGMWVFFRRSGQLEAMRASMIAGFIGGLGFSGAVMLKLLLMTSGLETNWHSILEQTYGFINGIAVAAAVSILAARAPRLGDTDERFQWPERAALVFTLLVIPFLNIQKNPERWVREGAVPESMYGLSVDVWFAMGFAAAAAAFLWLLRAHSRRPIPAVSPSWRGRGQLLFVLFLAIFVAANFERAVVAFAPQRLVTEGVIWINAMISVALLLSAAPARTVPEGPICQEGRPPGLLAARWTVACLAAVLIQWGAIRLVYGDRFAGHAGFHTRFGPGATATKAKPAPDRPHP